MKTVYYLGSGLFSLGLGLKVGETYTEVLAILLISFGLWSIAGAVFPKLPKYLNGNNQ